MSDVRVACETCGSIEVTVEDITVRCCDDATDYAYRFRCPKCAMFVFTNISIDVAALLLRAGAPVERWRLPLEMFERPEHTSPITHDDLIDFHEALAQWATATPNPYSAQALTSRVDGGAAK